MIVAKDPAHDRHRRGPKEGVGSGFFLRKARKSTSRGEEDAAREPVNAGTCDAQEVVATIVTDSGMLVHGTVNGCPVQFLVDTGSAVSLLSESLARDLGIAITDLAPLQQTERFCGAGGQPLQILGMVVVQLRIQECSCRHGMRVVRNLRHPCLLGRDVLSRIPCEIASCEGRLMFQAGKAEVNTLDEGQMLRTQERVLIPPLHQMVVWTVMDASIEGHGIIESRPDLIGEGGLVGTPTLVTPSEGKVPVCLINWRDDAVDVPCGARIGEFCPVMLVEPQLEDGEHGWVRDSPTESADQPGNLWSLLRVGKTPSRTEMNADSGQPLESGGGGLDPKHTHDAHAQLGAPLDVTGPRGLTQSFLEPELPGALEGNHVESGVFARASESQAPRLEGHERLEELRQMLEKHRNVFALQASELGRTHVLEHRIDTGKSRPIFQPPRRLPWMARETARELVDEMLAKGVIEDSVSPWSAPIVLVKKKDGSTRFCVDYRKLNDVTVKDPYPLPRIDDTLDALGGAKYFSTLDLCSGYHQLPMAQADTEKTAFSTPDGHYQFTVMPFGVCNGPSSFQRLMNVVLRGLIWRTCLVYLDDIIVFSSTFEEHLSRLEEVFKRLEAADLRLKPSKCYLLRAEVEFLGHVVTASGIQTDPAKVDKVVDWPTPANVGDVRSFLGFCGYYRRFVKHFATVAKPLTNLTKAENPFKWTADCQSAFDELRCRLTTTPTLAYPRFDSDAPRFVLDVDASGFGLGAVLSQDDEDGVERPIAYASRLLTAAERRYGSTKSEFLGAVWAFRHFRCYLLGRRFLVRTDHRALEHWRTFKEPSAIMIMARWMEFLSQFQFDIKYRQGRAHANADGLSRRSAPAPPAVSIAAVDDDTLALPTPLVQRAKWCMSDWANAQSQDCELSTFRTWLGIHPPCTLPRLTGVSPVLRKFWQGRQHFCMREGVVCRTWEEPENLGLPPRFQICWSSGHQKDLQSDAFSFLLVRYETRRRRLCCEL